MGPAGPGPGPGLVGEPKFAVVLEHLGHLDESGGSLKSGGLRGGWRGGLGQSKEDPPRSKEMAP